MHNEAMLSFLKNCQEAYHLGKPLISDEEFDSLAEAYKFYEVGYKPTGIKRKHLYQLYSLEKYYAGEDEKPVGADEVLSPKLDGSAVALVYQNGLLVQALTRGDGIIGEDVTDKFYATDMVPKAIPNLKTTQIIGEVVAPKTIENARNYASGALHLKDIGEFQKRDLTFVAYGVKPYLFETFTRDMLELDKYGFDVVTVGANGWDIFPRDGVVYRTNNNARFDALGYTAKHPRGAWAVKDRKDVETLPTVLREVRWQLGKGGKVTPVAEFDTIVIDDANISRATLHNAGFIELWDLHIGDEILITRAGGIIPKVVGKT